MTSPARQVAGLLGYVALFAVLLFGPAGTLRWPSAWVLLAVLFVVRGVSTVRLWRVQRRLLAERARLPLHPEQPLADRVLLIAFMASFAALVAFAAADVWHLRLLPPVPDAWRPLGLAAFAAGWWIVHLALEANAFAVTVVRLQDERGHAVADTGPYRVVRHPMYAGLAPVMLGLCVWLGSTAGALLAAVPIGVLAARVVVEERLLRARLPGYADYATRVRRRLVPGVW